MGWKMQWHLLGLFSDVAKVVQREVSFKVRPWEQPGRAAVSAGPPLPRQAPPFGFPAPSIKIGKKTRSRLGPPPPLQPAVSTISMSPAAAA